MEPIEHIEQAQKIWWQFTQSGKAFGDLTEDDFDLNGLNLTEIKAHIQQYGRLLVDAHSDATGKDTILSATDTGCFYCLQLFKGQSGVDEQSLSYRYPLCDNCGVDGLVSLDFLPTDTDVREAFVKDMEDIWFESAQHGAGQLERQYSVERIRQYNA